MSNAPVVHHGSHNLTFNQKRLYQIVRRSGPLSRADLTRKSGLTFPSVSRLVADLLAAGMVKEGVSRRGGMGKPPIELSVVPDHSYALGVYLNGDAATGSLINALGESVKDINFPAACLSEGVRNALMDSELSLDRLIGVCLSTSAELVSDDKRERLSADLGVSVFAESAIACSVRAERYFGSGSQLDRILYFDALTLELGVLINGTVLTHPGTVKILLGVKRLKPSPKSDVLAGALKGVAALVQAEALVAGGLSAEDFVRFKGTVTDLLVVPGSPMASNPALAAASVPIYETFGA